MDKRKNISTEIPAPIISEIPDTISAVYVDDLNIIGIHEAIVVSFAAKRGLTSKKSKESKDLKSKITSRMSLVDRMDLEAKIKENEEFIFTYNSGILWREYIEKAKPILDAYIPLASRVSKGVIVIGKKVKESEDLVSRRLEVIEDYLEVARKYITLDVTWKGLPDPKCPSCNASYDLLDSDEDEGIRMCQCGYEISFVSKSSRYKDSSKVNIGSRSDYDESETFMKSLQLYEGTGTVKYPLDIKERLDSYFIRKGYPIGNHFKSMPLNKKGRKDGTSVALLCEALKDCGLSNHYNSYNILGHIYWGWEFPDLSKIRSRIVEKYTLIQSFYNEIKTRISSLNFNILLFVILRSEDVKCDWSDFKMLISRSSLEYHQKMIKIICQKTGIKYTELI